MTPQLEFELLMDQLSSMTSVIRVRNQDEIRREVHGGENGEVKKRTERAVRDLRRTVEKLEQAIS